MKIKALKLAPVVLALFVGGCAGHVGAPITRFENVVLKNPHTGRGMSCSMRTTTQTSPAASYAITANQHACVHNARAAGFTHMIQTTRYP